MVLILAAPSWKITTLWRGRIQGPGKYLYLSLLLMRTEVLGSYRGCFHSRGLSCLFLKPPWTFSLTRSTKKKCPVHIHVVANKNLIHP